MEWFWLIFIILSGPLLIFLFRRKPAQSTPDSGTRRRPPGPPGWPVVGNIFDLGEMPHKTLCNLRDKFGPVIWLQLGSVGTLVVNSPNAAAKLFKTHDLAFSDRKCPDALTAHGFNHGSVAIANYTPYWRVMKRIGSTEFNTVKKVNESADIRRKCVDNMIRWIEESAGESHLSGGNGEVEITHFVFLAGFNVVGNMVFSEDILVLESKIWKEFVDSMNNVMEWIGKPNLSDYLPWLKIFDPLGIKKGTKRDMGKCLEIVANFVEARMVQDVDKNRTRNFLDVLLKFDGDRKESVGRLSKENINILLTEIFFAGTETMSSSIEWLMSELLNHPNCMRKVKEELDRVVGHGKKVEECDIDKLLYLQASAKEALRLHPPVPLLLPRNAREDTNYAGYFIPKGTQVIINAYGLGRDSEMWDDPLNFKPERFLNNNIELTGQHFGSIPFGAGRRICGGYLLGQRMLHFITATLIHTFDWEVRDSATDGILDMNEKMGITLRKLFPLKIIPKKRDL